MADVKGDLSGIGGAGTLSPKIAERLTISGLEAPAWRGVRSTFWDVFGAAGHPVRATISDMGPLVLGRLFDLNETQRGVLTLVFKIADDAGLLLLDVKDLRAMLQFVGENASQFTTDYGNVSAASIGAIQRALLTVDQQGGDRFFGEPMLNIDDLIQTDAGRPRYREHPCRRSADALAEGVRELPALDVVGVVRAPAGSGRPAEAEAGLLLRRSAPACSTTRPRRARRRRSNRSCA